MEQGLRNFHQTLETLEFGTESVNITDKYKLSMMNSMIVVHLRYLSPEVDYVDMTYTTWEKFANFGGNFGIFAEITGCTFLGFLNCIVLIFKCVSSKAYLACKKHIAKEMQERKIKKTKKKQKKIQQSKV